jgi:D-sedoheptulose 7-phosphate isomerase
VNPVTDRLDELALAVEALRGQSGTVNRWAQWLARRLAAGARLLAAGNGGSAAEAQHLTAELVGRFDGDRRPFSAIALHADTSSLTAIGNDYGFAEVFARQVRAHARPRDVLVLLSTSGRSRNLLAAASAGRSVGASVWALTGPAPNPLAELAEDAVTVPGSTATVQEAHLIAVHLLCAAFESALSSLDELSGLGLDELSRSPRAEPARPALDSPAGSVRGKIVSNVRRRRAS